MSDRDDQSARALDATKSEHELSRTGRYLVLVTAFLGWMFAGIQLGVTSLAMRSAVKDLLGTADEVRIGMWFSWCVCAFLLGAATGGFVFGWIGDRVGRTRAIAFSILTYSVLSGLTYYVQSPAQLLILRFLTCMGVGGMWPNGVALVSEAWSTLSRPVVAGVIGTAANFGIALLGWLAIERQIDAENWRWVLLVGATPVVLGVVVLAVVPESPRWLETRGRTREKAAVASVSEVFRPPLLKITIIGILLGAIPLMGGWGSANWVMPWAGEVGEQLNPPDLELKARLQLARSITSIVGALLGGLIASVAGRKRTYFLTSLGALACAQLLFWQVDPSSLGFLLLFGALGFFNGIYFGWLPFCLPEMFPTRVRSTGAGVSFNWGRILTVVTVFVSGSLLGVFGGYAEIGRVTSLIFAVGMVVIWFAPDTSRSRLDA